MKELVIFDVDNTIVDGQSQALFLKYLYKMKYVSTYYYIVLIIWLILYKFGILSDPLRAMKYGMSFAKGKSEDELQEIVDNFFEKILVNKLYKQALEVIVDHKKNNRDLILLSNAPDIIIRKLADYLEIDNFLSTKLEIINGVYTGNIFGEIMYGEQKLLEVKKYLDSSHYSLESSWAYGDHDSDIFLLSHVGHPFAVNPSKILKTTSIKNKWPILNFNI